MSTIKIFFAAMLLGTVLPFTSCKKWLEVNPTTQIREEEQFSAGQGFADALTGVYQQMNNTQLYGDNLTMGFLDIIAQQYTNTTESQNEFYQIGRYNYMDINVQGKINAVWSSMYTAIAHCNYILKNIDGRKDQLSPLNYAIIKGETLGLRAFMHLDLARLFAPAYVLNPDALAAPYQDSYGITPVAKIPLSHFLDKCENDLKEAEELMKDRIGMDWLYQPATNENLLLNYRQNRFNPWAVKATLARLYLYKGDKVNALDYAKQVIHGNQFRFVQNAELANRPVHGRDYTFSSEHVFSLYVFGLQDRVNYYFTEQDVTSISPGTNNKLIVSLNKKNEIFEISMGYSTDPRYLYLWQTDQNFEFHSKFWQYQPNVNVRQPLRNLMPLIRLTEMYYIAAESEADPEAGLAYLNKVREEGRFIPPLPAGLTAAQFDEEIFKEYKKEFISEGQLFYYYKRKGYSSIPGSPSPILTDDPFVLPLPMNELEFGR